MRIPERKIYITF